jgi:hypothetical protein
MGLVINVNKKVCKDNTYSKKIWLNLSSKLKTWRKRFFPQKTWQSVVLDHPQSICNKL